MQPNVLIIVSHDTGKHIAPYGVTTVHTPNFSRVAAEGVLARNHFCTAPQCSPARASLFTGRYPHANGVMGLCHLDFAWRLHAGELHASRLFHQAGYATWRLGIVHETSPAAADEGVVFDKSSTTTNRILDLAGCLRGMLSERDANKPFYAQLCCSETHRDFLQGGVEPDRSLGVTVPAPIPRTPESEQDYADFQGSIRRFDEGIGAILAALEEQGVLDETIVVVTTDHGAAMPWGKGGLYDRGIDALLLLRYPAWGQGRELSAMLSHVDLLPTVLEACDIAVPAAVQGESYLPLLRGEADAERRPWIWAEKTYHDCYDPQRCIRTERYKYIRYFEKSTLHRVTGDAIGRGAYQACGGDAFKRSARDELFDLQADPDEQVNLAEQDDMQELRRELAGIMLRTMEQTADPLLQGPIPSPYYHAGIDQLRRMALS